MTEEEAPGEQALLCSIDLHHVLWLVVEITIFSALSSHKWLNFFYYYSRFAKKVMISKLNSSFWATANVQAESLIIEGSWS